jgi:Bacteriophage baseplate protein W
MSAGAVALADIVSADWSLKLGAIGEVVQGLADIGQCIAIILTTPKGSDPLRPTFASDLWKYLDRPIQSAAPALVREAFDALALWEPRITVVSVSAAPDPASGSSLTLTVTWKLALGGAPQTTAVMLPTPVRS